MGRATRIGRPSRRAPPAVDELAPRATGGRGGHCAKLVFHLLGCWSYWRYEARHRAGSDPGCEVCRGRARVGRAQSPPVGGGRVARHRLRRRRGGFVGHRCGSGDDSQGAPGDCPRRGADGPHSTPWRRTAPHPAGSTRHPGCAPSASGSAHARRPDFAAALDEQESREAGGGADRAGVAGEFDHCGPAAAPPGLPAAIGAQTAGRRPRIRTATRSSSTSTRPRTSIWPPALTFGGRRPGFVPAEGGGQAWEELRERLNEASHHASAACSSGSRSLPSSSRLARWRSR